MLDTIHVDDSGPSALDKINDAIAAVSALQATVPSEIDAGIEAATTLSVAMRSRLGDNPGLFTTALAGGLPSAVAGLDPSRIVRSQYGQVYRVTGAAIALSRIPFWVEPSRVFLVRYAFARFASPSDPAGDTIRCAIVWLDRDFNAFTTSGVQDLNAVVGASGLTTVTTRMPSQSGDPSVFAPPAGAVYWRPYMQTFGLDGVTDLIAIDVEDVTDAAAYSPDLTALAGRVSTLEGEVATLNPLAAGTPNGLATLDSTGHVPASEIAIDSTVLGDVATMARNFSTFALFLAAIIPAAYKYAAVHGYYTPADGGGMLLHKLPSPPSTVDLTTVQTADGAWWRMDIEGTASPYHFGAKGDGINNDSPAIEQALSLVGYVGLPMPAGTFATTFAQSLQFPVNRFASGSPGLGLVNVAYTDRVTGTAHASWTFPFGDIYSDIVLPVPSVFPDVYAALTWLGARRIVAGIATIQFDDGTYNLASPILVLHPNGDRIHFLGNTATPANVVLNLPSTGNQSGFIVYNGYRIGSIDGVTINGVGGWTSTGVWAANSYGAGIYVGGAGSGVLNIGASVRIHKFYYGVLSDYGAYFNANGTQVFEAGDVGFHCRGQSVGVAINCAVFTAAHASQDLGAGFACEGNSKLDCQLSYAAGCRKFGFVSQGNSNVWAQGTTATGCGAGAGANSGGSISCDWNGVSNVACNYSGNTNGLVAFGKGFISFVHTGTILGLIKNCTGAALSADTDSCINGVFGVIQNNGSAASATKMSMIAMYNTLYTTTGNTVNTPFNDASSNSFFS